MSEKAMGEKEIKGILADLAQRFMEAISSWDDVVFIGVRSGGVLVARNVVKLVEEKIGKSIPLGTLDIGLYRDDLSKRLFYPEVRRTDIPFSVEGKRVVLVDDVLNTGRSVRAAIEHIVDLGRPRRIYLMVLFDRGGRELPIQADFVGKQVTIPEEKVIKLEAGKDEVTIKNVILSGVKR
ncbi:MAG TPA: bifunctional pyr operon transcriptional regulator/uracil phosphoribosyltransferase PyrR [Deltaproteobacteria bacterium]|mgnify:CR=1 FL=1|jgi:pyrimidine operon attenuation protein/uracil phosphoribosyltransferase|nr:bifunctional pyr operon transcriptional regulator/uracil phosphoribosyltransferase PyrR [Deltaproteobacteria bacterium]HOI06371.1 bifunctional pyr operon transcriptional regulator/uracil phosphoribosyltransferase PyrR [Deltaproteobacteria bacterium]